MTNTDTDTMPPKGRKRPIEEATTNGTDNAKKKQRPRVSHRSHRNVPGVALTIGQGDTGQLGLGEDIYERGRPAKVDIPDGVIQICAGGMHTACLTRKGEVYTFGCNDEGALGRDTSDDGSESLPGKVKLGLIAIQISAGDSHTAALSDDGKVYAWGSFRDANGSIGMTKQGQQKTPMHLIPDETVIKISSGSDHLACLTNGGSIYTLGCAEQGQLGRIAECFTSRGGRKGLDLLLKPDIVKCRKYKSKRRALFSDVWTGQYITFAEEKDTGDIYGWGLNNYFQLGFADMINRFVPERIHSFCKGEKWLTLSGGQHHTLALDSKGKVYSLGRREYGRLGLGENTEEKTEPTLIPDLDDKTCVDVNAGAVVSFAVINDGSVYSWGMGTNKQLGTGEEDDEWSPVPMSGKQLLTRSVEMVSAGGQHTVLLAKDK